jgi:hypothetical protein
MSGYASRTAYPATLLQLRLYLIYTIDMEETHGFMPGTVLHYDLVRGFGEMFWGICPACGEVSVRTILWEDGSSAREECLICKRMREVMELEEAISREAKR